MVELSDQYQPMDEIEAMVRAAGNFVQASEDLRPRVLESARQQRGNQGIQRWVSGLAVGILMLTAAPGHRQSTASRQSLAPAVFFPTAQPVSNATGAELSSEMGWGMVDAFTEMRRQQSEVLRLAM